MAQFPRFPVGRRTARPGSRAALVSDFTVVDWSKAQITP
jgi:hypothetical protein